MKKLILTLLTALVTITAQAALITYTFTGVVTFVDITGETQYNPFQVGDTMSGWLRWYGDLFDFHMEIGDSGSLNLHQAYVIDPWDTPNGFAFDLFGFEPFYNWDGEVSLSGKTFDASGWTDFGNPTSEFAAGEVLTQTRHVPDTGATIALFAGALLACFGCYRKLTWAK